MKIIKEAQKRVEAKHVSLGEVVMLVAGRLYMRASRRRPDGHPAKTSCALFVCLEDGDVMWIDDDVELYVVEAYVVQGTLPSKGVSDENN